MNQENAAEDIDKLIKLFEEYIVKFRNAYSDCCRLRELADRKSAADWTEKKRAKHRVKLQSLEKEVGYIEDVLDRLQYRLSQNGVEVDVVRKNA